MTSTIDIAHPGVQGRVARDLDRLRDSARAITGSVFYANMLKTQQQSKLRGSFGHGGRGEEVFAAQLHSVLAERMGHATERGLGDVLFERLQGQQRRMSQARVRKGEAS